MDGKALRERVAEARRDGGRVSPALQVVVVKYADERRAAGASMREVGVELATSVHTLNYWRSRQQKAGAAPLARVRVVEPERAASGFVVHGPRGLRIEVLSMVALAELIARLQ